MILCQKFILIPFILVSFQVTTKLVKQLYARDTRKRFCPHNHWLSQQISVHAERHSQIFKSSTAFVKRPFGALSALNSHRVMEEEGPPLSTTEVRHITVLTELPFVVPFSERIKVGENDTPEFTATKLNDMLVSVFIELYMNNCN